MPGVRIQHPTERNVMFKLVDRSRRYVAGPLFCVVCATEHIWKTYHLRLDGAGAMIVSVEIADRLKRLPGQGGFTITNEVQAPPAQRIVLSSVVH